MTRAFIISHSLSFFYTELAGTVYIHTNVKVFAQTVNKNVHTKNTISYGRARTRVSTDVGANTRNIVQMY